jgi:hypothetical protein
MVSRSCATPHVPLTKVTDARGFGSQLTMTSRGSWPVQPSQAAPEHPEPHTAISVPATQAQQLPSSLISSRPHSTAATNVHSQFDDTSQLQPQACNTTCTSCVQSHELQGCLVVSSRAHTPLRIVLVCCHFSYHKSATSVCICAIVEL